MMFLITFIALSIINVVFSTIRSIATIKSGKTIASLLSDGCFTCGYSVHGSAVYCLGGELFRSRHAKAFGW